MSTSISTSSLRSLSQLRLRLPNAAHPPSPSSFLSSRISSLPRHRCSLKKAPATPTPRRLFQSSCRRLQENAVAPPPPPPPKKPVGAFRGGLIGFLLGSTFAGASVYYYILDEYKISNEMLTSDIYAVQAAVQQIHAYVMELENKIAQLEKKK